jgi:hypothetical protein
MNRILLGFDSVLIDTCVCHMMGIDTDDVPYIGLAAKFGAGSMDFRDDTLIELNDASNAGRLPVISRKAKQLARYTDEREACSACYGSLIHALNRLDEKMKSLTEKLDKIQLTSRNMPRNLNCTVSAATDACAKLEMQIENMTLSVYTATG